MIGSIDYKEFEMDQKQKLLAVHHALCQMEVKGKNNVMTLAGIMQVVEEMIRDCDCQEPDK